MKFIKRHTVIDAVQFTGNFDDIEKFVGEMQSFVMVSYW